jgi:hypothetical protein
MAAAISQSIEPLPKDSVMSQRHDYCTICPECESRMPLTLSAQLQAGRTGTSCVCPSSECEHEWVCIQEWIFRDAQTSPANAMRQPDTIALQSPPASVAPARMPLPTYQPPQPTPLPQTPSAAPMADHAQQSSVPAPHAWSWELVTQHQHAPRPDHNAFGS